LSDPLGAVGLYWKMLPFQVDAHPSGLDEKIAGIHAELSAIEQHVLYPIDAITAAHDSSDLFYATFNFVSFESDPWGLAGDGLELLDYRFHDKFHYPLNYLFLWDKVRGVVGVKVEYDNGYFEDAEVERLNATCQRTIGSYVGIDAA
jgi:hypothetical protein